MRSFFLAILTFFSLFGCSRADVNSASLEYKDGNQILEGFLFRDPAWTGKRPGVLLAHELGAGSSQARQRALEISKLGYVTLSIDLYGKGINPGTSDQAAKALGMPAKDRTKLVARVAAAHAAFSKHPSVLSKQIAGVGYGWGGSALLDFTRGGGDLDSVAVIHGDLSFDGTTTPSETKPWILAIHGSEDDSIPVAQVGAFETEMRKRGFEWDVFRIGGAGKEFTNTVLTRDSKTGRFYDLDSDKRAHTMVKSFLAETFEGNPLTSATVATGKSTTPAKAPVNATAPKGVPQKAMDVLKYVRDKGEAMPNYEGGRNFGNFEKRLPQTDENGRKIRYREWDVNPLVPGRNRGAERLVTGSDGSAYYTSDHYNTFTPIK